MTELPDDGGNDEIPPERFVTVDGPRKLTDEQRERLKALAALPDDQIDYSDIPPIRFIPEHATIGKFFRPLTPEQQEGLKALAADEEEDINPTDLSKGLRGPVLLPSEPSPEGKVRMTVVLDEAVMDWFFEKADEAGGKVRHHDLINEALKAWIASH